MAAFLLVTTEGKRMKGVVASLLLIIWIAAAWITHVVVCLKTAAWGFLIAGALVFPVAWIHGTGIWFNWW